MCSPNKVVAPGHSKYLARSGVIYDSLPEGDSRGGVCVASGFEQEPIVLVL